jgi:hypothetical protein
VVGAGASKEFGLPVGSELAAEISKKLDINFDRFGREVLSGDGELFEDIRRQFPKEAREYQLAGWFIRDGIILASSIDDFLHVHQHDQRIVNYGKAAIAKCILEAERSSLLHFDPTTAMAHELATIDFRECSNTWLVKLMRLLGRGLPHADRHKIFDQSKFIIFNYDRCVEHFFINALQRFYNIEHTEAISILMKAEIIHPYGTTGELDGIMGVSARAPFGAETADYLAIGSKTLKTYTERVESERIKEVIREAGQIVFLGFAYHDQNLRLLADGGSLHERPMIGTALGMSPNDTKITKAQLHSWFSPRPSNEFRLGEITEMEMHLGCSQLFDSYSKSL